MLSALTSRLGYGGPAQASGSHEDHNRLPVFPAANSQQRVPSFSTTEASDEEDDDDNDQDQPALPSLDSSNLTAAPPLTISRNVVQRADEPLISDGSTASKKRSRKVFIEPGYSQLDWAKLKKSGTVDLRGPGVDSIRRVTPRELAKHKTKQDCWQAYNGKVYNVTHFLRYHPGGVPEIMRAAGKDGTELFMKYHPWVNVDMMLDGCLVGFLVPDRPDGQSSDSE